MKRIGLTMRTDSNQYGSQCDVIEHTYLIFFKKFDFFPILIPNIENRLCNFLYDMSLDGIVLSGGNDVSSEYETSLLKGDRKNITIRDLNEHKILNWAIQNQKPVLGICRGMQFINAFFGGGIERNLMDSIGTNHADTRHIVRFIDNPINLSGETIVNSYHHQGITKSKISNSLKVFALSQDSLVIEGIYHPTFPIVGVQWHPERELKYSKYDKQLILNLFDLDR